MEPQPIYVPTGRPMAVVVFASGGPGNFQAALDAADARPDLVRVPLLVTDRFGTASAAVARQRGIAILERDFEAFALQMPRDMLGREVSAAFHNGILADIEVFEAREGIRLDLAVLAYRRILAGALLERFAGRAINQHPADLAWLEGGKRAYMGIGGHARSLRAGHGRSRTSTILVRANVDSGEILCRGPWVPFEGSADSRSDVDAHEHLQKEKSDWPSLRLALTGIAQGRFGLFPSARHADGCHVVALDGLPLPYGGVALA